jgi:hypothetical protein
VLKPIRICYRDTRKRERRCPLSLRERVRACPSESFDRLRTGAGGEGIKIPAPSTPLRTGFSRREKE